MGYFDAHNDYHEERKTEKSLKDIPVLLILVSCGAMILVALVLRTFYDRRMQSAKKDDGKSENYVTEEWVTRKLDI